MHLYKYSTISAYLPGGLSTSFLLSDLTEVIEVAFCRLRSFLQGFTPDHKDDHDPPPDSPQPMSIDPQSANLVPSSWPHLPPPSLPPPAMNDGSTPSAIHDTSQTHFQSQSQPRQSSLPFSKACHNFLLVRHRQAARKRKLLLDYHKRVRAEQAEWEERMQVDTPATPAFPSNVQGPVPPAGNVESYLANTQQSLGIQPLAPGHLETLSTMHHVTIRNVSGIARVDESKPPRKRRRDLSPESQYQPFSMPKSIPFEPLADHSSPRARPATGRSASYHGQPSVNSVNHQHHLPTTGIAPRLQPPHASTSRSVSLLPSIEIRTPSPAHRLATGVNIHKRDGRAAETVRIGIGEHGLFGFERDRAEYMDRRSLEEMKSARRDAWLENLGEARSGVDETRSHRARGKSRGRR